MIIILRQTQCAATADFLLSPRMIILFPSQLTTNSLLPRSHLNISSLTDRKWVSPNLNWLSSLPWYVPTCISHPQIPDYFLSPGHNLLYLLPNFNQSPLPRFYLTVSSQRSQLIISYSQISNWFWQLKSYAGLYPNNNINGQNLSELINKLDWKLYNFNFSKWNFFPWLCGQPCLHLKFPLLTNNDNHCVSFSCLVSGQAMCWHNRQFADNWGQVLLDGAKIKKTGNYHKLG